MGQDDHAAFLEFMAKEDKQNFDTEPDTFTSIDAEDIPF
jgi:hypothetical protein